MKLFFKKLFSLIILALFVFLIWHFFHGWIEHQVMKLKGVYYIHKGDQAYSQDNMAKTLDYYKRGLELYPKHFEAWYNLGNIYAVYEDYYSAVEAYQHAIKANPKFVLARMNLGIVYSEDLGFFDEAIEQFDIVSDIKPFRVWLPFIYSNVKSARANRGVAYFNKGVAFKQKAMYLPLEKKYLAYQYLGDAIEAYTAALKILKKNYDIYYNRAVAHHLRGETRLAGLDYCKAIKLEPTRFEAHYNLAVLLRSIRHYRESISELEKAALLITEQPGDTDLQTVYIFNLLNEVSRYYATEEKSLNEKDSENINSSIKYSYVNGRVVADENFDKAMMKKFKTCAGFDYFKHDDYDEVEYGK